MAYQVYRDTTLGKALQDSLKVLVEDKKLSASLAKKVLMVYDRSVNYALANRIKSRVTFKAGKLQTYRFCDGVWTFVLKDVEFREVNELAKVDNLKIVGCDGKGTGPPAAGASAAARSSDY